MARCGAGTIERCFMATAGYLRVPRSGPHFFRLGESASGEGQALSQKQMLGVLIEGR